MDTRKTRTNWAWITAFLLPLGLTVGVTAGAAEPKTPLAGVPSETAHYPNGDHLQTSYDFVGGAKALPGVRRGMAPANVAEIARKAAATRLPAGFTLGPGATARIGEGGATFGAGAGGVAPKLITLYPVSYRGVALAKGSDYLMITSPGGKVWVERQRNLPAAVDATRPSVAKTAAVEVARADVGPGAAGLKASPAALEIWVDPEQRGHLAWTFTLASASETEPLVRRYWVAATGAARVLHWENEVYHTHFGTASGTLWPDTPLDATASRGLPFLRMTRSGGGGGSAITGEDGRYSFTTGAGTATISASLSGPFSVVQNMAGATMNASRSGTPAAPIDVNFGASNEFQLAQVSGFYWTNVAHTLARSILTPAQLANLPTRVNINSNCNAFWNGSSINFFRAGSGCPNTAYSDVVLHEYGHGVDAMKGGIIDGGYSEGFGDAMAVLGTKQVCVGRNFFGAGTCLRRASDVILWPPAPGEGVHAIGRRYAGFVWELVQQLRNTYSEDEAFRIATELVLAAAAANPANIPDAVRLSFIADDTDGNLATCSPHFKELAAAADSRHIPRPANCVSSGAGGASPGSSAHFIWIPSKKVSSNSNILQATIHLDQPMEVHISANTSARSISGSTPRVFTTGFYNQPPANVMWSYSLRDVTAPAANQWVNFSSMIAMNLPAGNHTIYWKLWTSGGTLELSGGTLLIEGFKPSPAMAARAAAAPPATTTLERGKRVTRGAP